MVHACGAGRYPNGLGGAPTYCSTLRDDADQIHKKIRRKRTHVPWADSSHTATTAICTFRVVVVSPVSPVPAGVCERRSSSAPRSTLALGYHRHRHHPPFPHALRSGTTGCFPHGRPTGDDRTSGPQPHASLSAARRAAATPRVRPPAGVRRTTDPVQGARLTVDHRRDASVRSLSRRRRSPSGAQSGLHSCRLASPHATLQRTPRLAPSRR